MSASSVNCLSSGDSFLHDFVVLLAEKAVLAKSVFVAPNKLPTTRNAAKTGYVINLILGSHHEIGFRHRP